ncbi:MAG: PIG-L family deacetylase [Bryobacteraceae bacterium]
MRLLSLCLLLIAPHAILAQASKSILVVTAGSGDYLHATAGTLLRFIGEGYTVYVVQLGNDEKNSAGLNPAETRLANDQESDDAARMLGVKEVVRMNHKSGELAQVSVNEMRSQIMTLIRLYRPQMIFHPDPWVHYQPDWDQFWAGRASEESSYGSSNYFLPEVGKLGFAGYGVPETFYYAAGRPYRPGEGGHQGARFRGLDITAVFEQKLAAIEALRTANHRYAMEVKQRLAAAGRSSSKLAVIDDASTRALMRAWVSELAETVGAKHGFRYGEEFNYHGRGDPVPTHIREKARPVR